MLKKTFKTIVFFTFSSIVSFSYAADKGLTWVKTGTEKVTGIVDVGCGHTPGAGNQCNPYNGDTSCDAELPVLCFLETNLERPPSLPSSNIYHSWSGGIVGTTKRVAGNSFSTIGEVNEFCQSQFGQKWRVAEHHDGWGWYFTAYGEIGSQWENNGVRYWVDINDQPSGTCWAH